MTLEVRLEKGCFENSPIVSLRLCLGTFSFQLALPLNVPLSWPPFLHLKMSAVQITCSTKI